MRATLGKQVSHTQPPAESLQGIALPSRSSPFRSTAPIDRRLVTLPPVQTAPLPGRYSVHAATAVPQHAVHTRDLQPLGNARKAPTSDT